MKPVSEYLTPVGELLSEQPRETLVAASAVVALGLLLALAKRSGKDKQEPRKLPLKAPTALPVLGSLLDIAKHQERFHEWTYETSRDLNNKPWVIDIPGRSSMIVISTPELFEDVMKTQDDIFLRGPEGQYISLDLFGNGMVITDGDPWWFHRRTASHLFSLRMIKEMMGDVVREKLAVFVDVLNKYAARGTPFSIKRDLSHFTMDVISKIGFGVELHTLRDGADMEKEHEYLESFDKISVVFGQRIQTPIWLWELKKKLNIGSEKVMNENLEKMNKFLNEIIANSVVHKNELAARGEKSGAKDLVSLFLESKLKDEEGLKIEDDDATIMRDMVVTFTFAGKDSTAHAMSWFIVFVNRYPHVLEKIREEMREKVPGLLTGEVQLPTNEQLAQLVYLDAAMRETMRLYPSTGFIVRQAMEATTLCDGTYVEKDQTVMISSFCNARNKKTWGEDALEFKPERFIDETGKLKIISPYVFSSFGSGMHQCIGQKFAMMEIKTALATIFSKFDIKTVEDPWQLTYEFSLTIPVKGSLDVVVTALPASQAAAA